MIDVLRTLGVAVLLVSAGCGVTEVLDRADDGRAIVIRSPQPDADDLRELAAEHGLRTVVNLRGLKPGKSWYWEERDGVEAIGARWVHMNISGSQPPRPDVQKAFFEIVEDPNSWPVLIHCMGGIHRTGVMAALYRIQYMGWSAERAIAEMEDRYFDWTVRDRDALKEFLRAYRRDPERVIDRAASRENR